MFKPALRAPLTSLDHCFYLSLLPLTGDWSPNQTGVKLQGKDGRLAVSGPNFAVWEVAK
jgi:hypothetical protein